MTSVGQNDTDFWQNKCKELEKVIKTLSNHCMRVIDKHEELLDNYKKNQSQYNVLVQKLKEKGEQIKKAKEVLGPVTQEYEALREKYEIAVRCQYEAERFATQVNSKNKVLKRQSQMLLDKVSGFNVVEFNFGNEEDDDEENEYIKKLSLQVEELEEKSSTLYAELKEVQTNYAIELDRNNEMHKQIESLKKTIAKYEENVALLTKTSEAAFNEYKHLEEQYEREITDRANAEKIAHNLYGEREAARRQSAMLMKDIAGERKLMEALIEIEELTTKMETMRKDFEYKIQLLEDQLKSETDNPTSQSLEGENSSLLQERDSLLMKLTEAEKAAEDQRSQYLLILKKYEELETKYEYALSPPPPPAPPLPPQMSKSGGFLAKITGGGRKKQKELTQKRLQLGGAAVNNDYSKAVDEMMKRIQQGNIGLRPVLKSRTASCPDQDATDGKAMMELQGILNKMKKARSEDDLSVFDDEPKIDENTELFQKFKQIQSNKVGPKPAPRPAPRKLSMIKDEADEEKA
ncbi:unnamed protein product [Lymnaea stagnalis]|uniref:Shootin-1 n=1 Tax=Lymnaea stagnalis TaxID=6523 RepID=A0AAV2H4H8_LYMST